jgi:AhpD family alkylhydroperoxidase
MNYKAKTDEMRAQLRVMNKLLPETAASFAQLSKAAIEEGTLDRLAREYIALAIAVTQRCKPCINFHIEALISLGATRNALAAALSVCVQMGGGPALMYGAHALAAWDEMTMQNTAG